MTTATSVLDRHALKLSKNWLPIESTTVREAITDVFEGKARVLDARQNDEGTLEVCQLHGFEDWMRQSISENDRVIHTPSGAIKVPEIIIVNGYAGDPNRKRVVLYNRRNVWRRDNGFCQYCGCKCEGDDWEIEHVIPKSRGGKTCFENAVVSCTACNREKADRTPREAGMPLQRTLRKRGKLIREPYDKPKRPRWSPMYSIKRREIPRSWEIFLRDLISDMYWDVELEDE